MFSRRGIMWGYGCGERRGLQSCASPPGIPSPLPRTGTHHAKWQFLVQRVVGEVMQRHGGGQRGSVVGRGVCEAGDGVLLPSQVHVIVYPLQRLWGKQLGWEGHPKFQAPDTGKTETPWASPHHHQLRPTGAAEA